jgi:hypothetical protein
VNKRKKKIMMIKPQYHTPRTKKQSDVSEGNVVIHKINLMGVPLQIEDLLFNIDRKKERNR